ncbi:hypothetical protein ccbrp13_56000 [Ktedonobacteria bacterium brp13]|nr:hypothetical protein ccbrp13_56000 [Ktedonobacteria bacterium brp13]
MSKKLLAVLARIANALEESNEITRDIQQQTLAIAERQQQALQEEEERAKNKDDTFMNCHICQKRADHQCMICCRWICDEHAEHSSTLTCNDVFKAQVCTDRQKCEEAINK